MKLENFTEIITTNKKFGLDSTIKINQNQASKLYSFLSDNCEDFNELEDDVDIDDLFDIMFGELLCEENLNYIVEMSKYVGCKIMYHYDGEHYIFFGVDNGTIVMDLFTYDCEEFKSCISDAEWDDENVKKQCRKFLNANGDPDFDRIFEVLEDEYDIFIYA